MSIYPLKPLLMHPRAPTTTGITSTLFSDQSLFSSQFKFWHFSIFSISFLRILQSPGVTTSMMTHDFAFLSTKIKSSLLASIRSHWIFISQIYLTSSSSTLLQGNARTTSLFFQGYASRTISNGTILQLCHVFSYTHAALVFYIHILYAAQFLPFHLTFYTIDFLVSCRFYYLYKLSLMLVLVQHISLLQFAL